MAKAQELAGLMSWFIQEQGVDGLETSQSDDLGPGMEGRLG